MASFVFEIELLHENGADVMMCITSCFYITLREYNKIWSVRVIIFLDQEFIIKPWSLIFL